MGAERTFPREDKRKGFAPPPCAVTLAKCRRYRGTLSCAGRASGGGTQSHLSCVRVGSDSSLGGGQKDKHIFFYYHLVPVLPEKTFDPLRRAGVSYVKLKSHTPNVLATTRFFSLQHMKLRTHGTV